MDYDIFDENVEDSKKENQAMPTLPKIGNSGKVQQQNGGGNKFQFSLKSGLGKHDFGQEKSHEVKAGEPMKQVSKEVEDMETFLKEQEDAFQKS